MSALSDYYELAKPGIIYGNLITLAGGFLLASGGAGSWAEIRLFIAAALGLSLVIASGSVFNNYIDRDIDSRMERTKDRALVAGRVEGRKALAYGMLLGGAGFAILLAFTNMIAVDVAAIGFFFYVFAYTLWTKRRWTFGTVVGSVSGAVPPVVGYAAAAGRLDADAAILFLILAMWQMPHFFAIGIYRREEYAAAGIPILPVRYGVAATKRAILLYTAAFAVAALALGAYWPQGAGALAGTGSGTVSGAEIAYLAVAAIASIFWIALALGGFRERGTAADSRWARRMFFVSLIVLAALFVTIGGAALFL